ncbi:alpha/beta hydrolase [Actinomadura sp. KC216]|uniref:alpha/beta hydrolase n=1 Tax=Actinomadura sp. KC216 TaxID=2530370 RepID=UPI0014047107|nr:alpha/beta hydrolase [Actinomadura sp. KC216]
MLYRDFDSQEALDAEYVVEEKVDIDAVLAQYVALSKAARSTLDTRLDLRFGPTRDEHLDLYLAGGGSVPRPVLVFVHGGYWRTLSSKEFGLVAPGPAAHGIDVVVTNYSLAPKVAIDEITRQSRATVRWVYEHAASWGGDPNRIYVSGHSAGGQQVAMLLETDWVGEYDLPADVIKGGIAVSGVFDLRPLPYTALAPALQLSRGTIERQSPLLREPRLGAPLVVTWGEAETAEFRRQSEDYIAACRAAGCDVHALPQPGVDHFQAILGFNTADGDLTHALLEQMKRDPGSP